MKQISNEQIANNLKGYRVKAGFTQENVAELLGVDKRTIINYESNAGNVKLDTYVKLANIYGCCLQDFFMASNITQSEVSQGF